MLKWLNPLNSLFGRILISFWLAFTLVTIATSWLAKQSFENPRYSELNAEQQNFIQHLAERNFDHMRGQKDLQVYLFDENNRLLSRNNRPPKKPVPPVVLDQLLSQSAPTSVYWRGKHWLGPIEQQQFGRTIKVVIAGGPPGEAIPFLARPALYLLVVIVVSSLLAVLLAWSISKPLRSLSKTSRTLADGDLTARPESQILKRGDEFGSLAREFNDMATQLVELINAQQHLLANVSHELRSPLTRLQLAAAIARAKLQESPAELDRIDAESQRLEKLIAKLLKLSRLKNQLQPLERQECQIDTLLNQLIQRCQPEAEAKGLTIDTQLTSSARIALDQELIFSALENIYRNAIRFTGEQSSIRILSEQQENWLHISICDQGPGIAPEELDSIFEPFTRASNSDNKGTGLGLAIAYQAVKRHGGEIEVQNIESGGLCMCIKLPLEH